MDVLLPEIIAYITIFLSDASLFSFFYAGGWALINKDLFRRLRLTTGRLQPARILESAIVDEDNFELWHYLLENHFKFLQLHTISPIIEAAIRADSCHFMEDFLCFFYCSKHDYHFIEDDEFIDRFSLSASASMLTVLKQHKSLYDQVVQPEILLHAIARGRWKFLREMGAEWIITQHGLLKRGYRDQYDTIVQLMSPPLALPATTSVMDVSTLCYFDHRLIDDLLLNPTTHIIQLLGPYYPVPVFWRLVQMALCYSDNERLQMAFQLMVEHEITFGLIPNLDVLLPFFNRIDQLPIMEEYYRKLYSIFQGRLNNFFFSIDSYCRRLSVYFDSFSL